MRARLLRSFSSASCRSLKSRTARANPCSSPASSLERHGDGIGPETGSVLPRLPAFRAHMAFESGPVELVFQRGVEHVVAGVKHGYVLLHCLVGLVPVNAGCSRIPRSDTSLDVQQVQRIVLHP